jgi:uncharacterized protein (TIGR00251 family)
MTAPEIQSTPEGLLITIKVVPGSSRTTLCGTLESMLKIKVAAPPEKGKANACIIDYLAKTLGIKKKAIRIVSGQTASIKQILIQDLSAKTLLSRLNLEE